MDCSIWVTEALTPGDLYVHGVTRVLAAARTDFQDMQIVESPVYGKALVLDGLWQSCTGDEFLYHEPLVHVGSVLHGAPKRALVLGGGEGATVRELLRWKTIETVRMVDIDGQVVDACIEHLPEMHQGAFDDPRTDLVIGDALHALDESDHDWDLVISDLSDPIEDGPSFRLFTREYYEQVEHALAPGGVFVLQAGPVSPSEYRRHARLHHTVKAVFPHVASFWSCAPTYGQPWGFVVARREPIDVMPDVETVDALLRERLDSDLRMFDGRTMLGMLQPPKHVRDAIASETTVFTLAEPPKFYGKGVAESS